MAISILELYPRYATIFRENGMMDALSKVESTTPSKVEKYQVFFGNVGVILESGVPLPVLVVKAKGLIGSTTQGLEITVLPMGMGRCGILPNE